MGMADVSSKEKTVREARARAFVLLPKDVVDAIREDRVPKGNVAEISKVCGIMAVKETSGLLPLCHPIPIENASVSFSVHDSGIEIIVHVKTEAKTGCEMEALTGAALAALNVYDMCKVFTKRITIREIELLEKSGGKSGDYRKQ